MFYFNVWYASTPCVRCEVGRKDGLRNMCSSEIYSTFESNTPMMHNLILEVDFVRLACRALSSITLKFEGEGGC